MTMKKFRIEKDVFEKLPNYCVGIVVAKGIDNEIFNKKVEDFLDNTVNNFATNKKEANIRELVSPYREAFYALEMNPNKYMCSIEALLKRVQKGSKLPHINTIVDLGNAFSVKYELPLGAHDVDKLEWGLEVRFSKENDTFLPLGETETENMPTGELVYASSNTVKTRRWIWRQSNDGKIEETTQNVFFPIDGFKGINDKQVLKLRDELVEFLTSVLCCKDIKIGFVDKANNEFVISE